jgi:hypothetical protein
MNLVAECITTSAPSASGCWLSGVANVLSTATIVSGDRGVEQIAGRSATVIKGFSGDSSHTRSQSATASTHAAVSAWSRRRTDQRP